MYNRTVANCFSECVTGFKSKMLDKHETTCVEHCAEKFLKTTSRVGLRFQEIQAQQQMKQQQQQQS